MAISPPGDIVLDVARAVDANDLKTARAQLEAAVAARLGKTTFPETAGAADTRQNTGAATEAHEVPASFRKFEAMVLQTFTQSMLPTEAEAVYGKGLAGEMWKTFLAQELAGVMAERGGIGIADRVLGDFYLSGEKRIPVAGIDGDPVGTAVRDNQTLLSSAMVDEFQRMIVRGFDADVPESGDVDR